MTHPLFEPTSFYRLATRESVWRDGGLESVRAFFQHARREELHFQWAWEPPEEPQPWGFAADVDQQVHEFLRRSVPAGNLELSATAGPRPGPRHPEAPLPGLLVARLDLPGPVNVSAVARSPREAFTGIGERPSADWGDRWEVNLTGLPGQRSALVLIMASPLVDRLAVLLSLAGESGDADQRVRAVVAKVFDAQTLHGGEDEASMRLAFHVSCTLARCPALECITTPEGQLHASIDFKARCPGLCPGTWVVAAIGPEIEGRPDLHRYPAQVSPIDADAD